MTTLKRRNLKNGKLGAGRSEQWQLWKEDIENDCSEKKESEKGKKYGQKRGGLITFWTRKLNT